MPDAAQMFHYCTGMTVLLRMLRDTDQTMTYRAACEQIGAIQPGQRWLPLHMSLISRILYLVAAVDNGREFADADYHRVHNRNGIPGSGVHRTARLVVSPPAVH